MNFDDEERFYQIREESEAQVNEVKMEIKSSNEGGNDLCNKILSVDSMNSLNMIEMHSCVWNGQGKLEGDKPLSFIIRN